MIVFVFNNYFPDNSGFAKRCAMEVEALSRNEEVIILCRKNAVNESPTFATPFKNIKVIRYGISSKIIERPKTYISGLYEIVRNIKLISALGWSLHGLLSVKKRGVEKIKIYAVSSPLIVPLVAYLIGKLHGVSPEVIEFHDLEPELAKHIKKLNDKSLITRIEYFLEKWMCAVYKKVIVTSQGQSDRIKNRTKIDGSRIFVIPNTFFINKPHNTHIRVQYKLNDDDFVACYSSTIYFDYTFTGVEKLICKIPEIIKKVPTFKLMIIGSGEGVGDLKETAKKLSLENKILFTGKVQNVPDFLQAADFLIIPWEKDEMTETILPTKLFEYMQMKKPIIVPRFGEFESILLHNYDALLYSFSEELVDLIEDLNKNKQLRLKLGANAYEKFKNDFDPQKQIRKLQEIIAYDSD